MNNSAEDFMRESKLCDFHNDIIIGKAAEISARAPTKRETARRIFSYVRDAIPFNATLDIFQKASRSINQKVIDYCNKANVHAALLKASGIPARLHYVKVRKERLKATIPETIYGRLPDPIGHYYCECLIENEWIACEAIYDADFYRGMIDTGIVDPARLPTIDWDGETDLVLFKGLVVEDVCVYANIDDVIENELKKYAYPPVWICKLFDWAVRLGSSGRTNKIRKRAD